mgnify:CR=1 FL=1
MAKKPAAAAATAASGPAPKARLQEHYNAVVVQDLMKKFGYKSRMEVPRIQKVTAEVRREIAERLPALQRSTTLRAFWRWLTARG